MKGDAGFLEWVVMFCIVKGSVLWRRRVEGGYA